MTLEIDFETRSRVNLKTAGAHNYFADPSTEPLMASYQIDGGALRRWRPPAPCPDDIVAHVATGGMISAHNAAFERQLWQMILTPRYGWPETRTEQFRCTAATAAAMALPRKLEHLGDALGLTVQKDKEGTRLINRFSKPWSGKFRDPSGPDFEAFHDYCDVDVLTEAEADRRMVPLSAEEQAVYTLSERINDRGIRIDIESAKAALALADKAKALLDREMTDVTGGVVRAATNVGKLTEWIAARGVHLNSAAKADLAELLELDEDLPADVRRAVEIRQEAAKTSVSKLKAMVNRASADGRVRGSFLFCGASTGRWSNVGVNFANMPRPRQVFDAAHLDRGPLFRAIRSADPDTLRFLYGDDLGRPLHLLSDAIRGFIWAAPGQDLIQADYSGIEGAVAAWVAGEDWKVAALHDIIADPSLPDLYRRTAASILNLPIETVTKKHWARQAVGKVSELALGYQGGVSAFVSMARNYAVKLDPLFGPVWETTDAERRDRAIRRYESCVKNGSSKADVLSREAWLACEVIKVGWRASNPAIAGAWKKLEAAIREAVQNPGKEVPVLRGVTYKVALGFLWCRLPSGRCLAYASPKLKDQVWAKRWISVGEWGDAEVMDREEAERLEREWKVKIEGETSPKATALGVNSVTRKFERFGLYGGLAFENVVQAIARDLLVNGMWKAEAAGYPIIAHVYDEIIAEVPRGLGDLQAFEKLICELPAWAEGMPLTAGGWRGKRYRKD